MMNHNWVGDLIELQRRAMEFSQTSYSSEKMRKLLGEYLTNWGIPDSVWEKRPAPDTRPQGDAPSVNLKRESGNEAILHIFLPGIAGKEDLTVTFMDDILHITGKSKVIGDRDGLFSRLIRLPFNIDISEIKASFEADYLVIRLSNLKNKYWQMIDVKFPSEAP
jgi:HSP20 family molecular chaperone IbpA